MLRWKWSIVVIRSGVILFKPTIRHFGADCKRFVLVINVAIIGNWRKFVSDGVYFIWKVKMRLRYLVDCRWRHSLERYHSLAELGKLLRSPYSVESPSPWTAVCIRHCLLKHQLMMIFDFE